MVLTLPKKIQINVDYIFKVQKFDSLKNINQLLVGYPYDRYVIIYSVSVLRYYYTIFYKPNAFHNAHQAKFGENL